MTARPAFNRVYDLYSSVEFDRWVGRHELDDDERSLITRYLSKPAATLEAGTGSGRILLPRVIVDRAFVDTLASQTDRLADRPNDAIVFACLNSAPSVVVKHAHYSLKSSITTLEDFKASLGFVAHPFPAKLHVRAAIGWGLRVVNPSLYRRLRGETQR